MSAIDDHLTQLAERQHGLVTRQQAQAAGLGRDAWRHRLQRSDWDLLTPRDRPPDGIAEHPIQRALALCSTSGPPRTCRTDPGSPCGAPRVPGRAVRGHRAARSPHAEPPGVAHHPRHVPDPFAAVLDGVPVARPALLLLQVAPRIHPDRLARLLDWFWTRRLLSGPSAPPSWRH